MTENVDIELTDSDIEHNLLKYSHTMLSEHTGKLPKEIEEGNVEYKRQLLNPSHERFEHLVTQMKWR